MAKLASVVVRSLFASLLASFHVIAWTSPAAAATVDLPAIADNTLYQSTTGALSNGAGQHLFAGETNDALIRRGLLRFDLTGIPAGATITSVELRLQMSRTRGPSTSVALHRLLADWGEGTSDAPDQEGEGAPSTTGDATWIHRSFNTTNWASPGGDFAPAASAAIPVGDVGAYTWTSTAGLVGDIQDWLDGVAPNHGWILIGSEGGTRTAKRFDSRTHPTAANQPRLTIVYATPVIGACCLGDGTCTATEPASCTGSYQGDNTTCGVGGTCGACCDGPTCELKIDATCTAYQGDATTCATAPCPPPVLGACCLGDGTCTQTEAASCPGSYQGDNTACGAGGTCGACCDGPTCALAIASTCAGTYQGDATTCVTAPCAGATGACCQDEICSDARTPSECTGIGGEYQGHGQTCSTDPCGDDSRACCLPGETCIVMNRDVCEMMGGERQGGSSTCADNPCATVGACCTGTSCTEGMTEDDCERLGGHFEGGQPCGPTTCDEIRACCLPLGGCTMIDERVCDSLGGDHQPPGVTCTPNPCAGAPCDANLIRRITSVLSVKTNLAADVHMSWQPDANATAYNTWVVTDKRAIPTATSTGPAPSVSDCRDRSAPDCTHSGAVSPGSGSRLFYNVLGVCNGTEAAE